jgi:hypothetical protein
MEYTFEWLAGYQALPEAGDSVFIAIGDHQPGGGITGPNANWDVPVHIVTSNPIIAERLRFAGFTDGINPPSDAIGHISDLNQILLDVFDSGDTRVVARRWPRQVPEQLPDQLPTDNKLAGPTELRQRLERVD